MKPGSFGLPHPPGISDKSTIAETKRIGGIQQTTRTRRSGRRRRKNLRCCRAILGHRLGTSSSKRARIQATANKVAANAWIRSVGGRLFQSGASTP